MQWYIFSFLANYRLACPPVFLHRNQKPQNSNMAAMVACSFAVVRRFVRYMPFPSPQQTIKTAICPYAHHLISDQTHHSLNPVRKQDKTDRRPARRHTAFTV